jgi:cell division protein FtsL
MKKCGTVLKSILLCALALCIPALLVVDGIQARRYTALEHDVADLEKKQADLVEQNKKLITDISLLSSSDRIEGIAQKDLQMRPAESDEIVRVEMKGSKK